MLAGNESTKTIVVDKIDKTPPSKTTVNLNGYISGTWTNSNVTQTFSSIDDYSGILRYEYSHDGINPVGEIPNPWIISFDGQWQFFVRAIDKAGNIGQWSDMYIIKRDTGAPAKPSIPDLISEHDTGISNTDNITKYWSQIIITGTAEANSYIRVYKNDIYYKDCRADSNGVWSTTVDNEHNSWTYYKVTSGDEAGNWSVESDPLGIFSDVTPPTVPSITYNSGENTCSWKNNYNLSFLASDNGAGVWKYEIDVNNDQIADQEMGNNFVPWNELNSCTARFRTVDGAGNVSEWSGENHIHMDLQNPTLVKKWYSTPVNGTISLYVQVADNIGISHVMCPTRVGAHDWLWYSTVFDESANAYRADIKGSDFGEYGDFTTHVYIYDISGNSLGVDIGYTTIKPPANYGVSTMPQYSNIYLSNNPEEPFRETWHLYDKYYNGNYNYIQALYDKMSFLGETTLTNDSVKEEGTHFSDVLSGTNNYNFKRASNKNRWMGINIRGAGGTTSAKIGNIKLIFENQEVISISEAVNKGYVEPLVLIAAGSHNGNTGELWTDVYSLLQANTYTSYRNFPWLKIIFKLKNISLIAVQMNSSVSFNTRYDGISVQEFAETVDLSISPF